MINLSRKTKRIRYSLSNVMLKYLTPKLYQEINRHTFKGKDISFIKDTTPIIIRPAIKFIKKTFKDKLLIGLELGVKRGNNAKSILNNLKIKKLYLIDMWLDYYFIPKYSNINYNYVIQLFKQNSKVQIIKGKSLEIIKDFNNNELDFIYIDSNHSYISTYNDIYNWIDKVKINGIVSGHDIRVGSNSNIFNPNGFCVFQAVNDFCKEFNYNLIINEPDWYFIKRL